MTRTLYDSTNARDIPDDAQMVAGYLDGSYYWKESDFDRWAHVPRIFIAVFPTTLHGNCLDVEPGNSTPDDRRIGDWVMNRRENGIEPTIYTMYSWWDDLQASFSRWGINEPQWWIASWDGRREMYSGAVGKQYLHGDAGRPAFYSGGHYDVTVCADEWPGVDGGVIIPKPPTAPGGGGAGTTYIVQPGDSLSSIGEKFGIPWQAIHAANQWIQNPNYIQVGWTLTIPGGGGGAAPAPSPRTYVVQPGDNLSAIANKYGTSWQALFNANRDRINNPDYIQVGWVLRIP